MLKKLLVVLIGAFAVYYLLTAPAEAAEAVDGAFSAVIDAFGSVLVFVQELFE